MRRWSHMLTVFTAATLILCAGYYVYVDDLTDITSIRVLGNESVVTCPPCDQDVSWLLSTAATTPQDGSEPPSTTPPPRGPCDFADPDLPVLYVITPTYTRTLQRAELTRMSQTLMHVPSLHWVLVEDANSTTQLVSDVIERSGICSTQMSVKDPHNVTHRGMYARNAALDWLRRHHANRTRDRETGANETGSGEAPGRLGGGGVVYFADDDNTYDIRLFEEIRNTRGVSVFHVGLAGGVPYEGPRCFYGKVIGFVGGWGRSRKYPLDMAAFAVNVDLLLRKSHVKFHKTRAGYLETNFIEALISGRDQLEAKACDKVLVWHTKTADPSVRAKDYNNKKVWKLQV